MKKITKIEYQKNNKDRVNIYLDNEYSFAVYLEVFIKYSLKKSMEIDSEFIENVLFEEERIKYYNYAIKWLSTRPRTEKEVNDKLKEKGCNEDTIFYVIDQLKKNKYINDEEYTEMFINSKINTSTCGKIKIQEDLKKKGIDNCVIKEKIASVLFEDEMEIAHKLAEKKLKTIEKLDMHKKIYRLNNFLISRGFSYEISKKIVNDLVHKNYQYND